jgi:phospholipid/cholesterol/gamma-HCH transport system permease protein
VCCGSRSRAHLAIEPKKPVEGFDFMRVTLDRSAGTGAAVLKLSADIVLDDAAILYDQISRLSAATEVRELQVDFSEVGTLDTAGAAAAKLGVELFKRAGRRCNLTHLSDQHSQALALVMEERAPPKESSEDRSTADALRAVVSKAKVVLFDVAEMVVDTVWSGFRSIARRDKRRLLAVAEQTVVLGVDATFIVSVLSFLIGVILAFQGAFQLSKFGAGVFMAELVSLGMVREFAPIITAIILAGRSGAAMAAEIGTMSVNDEVDALKSMGISTAHYLVFPRVAAITVAQPLLTILSMAIGIFAGIAMGALLGIPRAVAFHRMQEALVLDDFMLGLLKSVLFAWIIGFVGCFMGLATRGGASSVGKNTTTAVVLSIFLIVVTDSIVTTAWTLSHGTKI